MVTIADQQIMVHNNFNDDYDNWKEGSVPKW